MRRKVEGLQESKRMYQDLYDDAPDMYFTVAPDGAIKSVNDFGSSCLGYKKEELVGKPVWIIVHKDDLKKVQNQVSEILKKRLIRSHLEFRKVRKNGSVILVQERTRLILDKNDNPVELRIMCRDVTRQKKSQEQLRESEDNFNDIFDNSSDIIQCIGPKGNFLYANSKWMQAMKYTKNEIKELNIADIIHKSHLNYCMEVLRKIIAGRHINSIKTLFVDKYGYKVAVEGKAIPRFREGKFISTLGIFHVIKEKIKKRVTKNAGNKKRKAV